MSQGCDEEGSYIPFVKAYIDTCKAYDGPKEVANGVTKQLKRKSQGAADSRSKKRKNEAA